MRRSNCDAQPQTWELNCCGEQQIPQSVRK
jgi:hypothetical protein